jgi:hypothetical protein
MNKVAFVEERIATQDQYGDISDADREIEMRISYAVASDVQPLGVAQSELSATIKRAGLHFEGRPYPVCLRPLAITDRLSDNIAHVAERFVSLLDTAAELYCGDRGCRRLFPVYDAVAPLAVSLPPIRPIVRVCRFDGLIAADGEFRILETNTEGPGGVIQNGRAGRIWSRCNNPLIDDLELDVFVQPFVCDPDCFLKELFAAHFAMTGRRLERAAIVNYRGRFTNEVDWMLEGLNRHGVSAALLDAASLKRTLKGVTDAAGNHIDLAYNKLDIRDTIDAPEIADYLAASAAGEITSINPLIAQWILSDKAILALLSDDQFAANFTSMQRRLIRTHVPWTRFVTDGWTTDAEGTRVDLISYVEENRQSLVLKPSNATRGENVMVGCFTTPADWQCHLSRAASVPYVVQEYIRPPRLSVPHPLNGTVQRMSYGLDAYVFGGKFSGFQARASLDPVMNVGKRGVLLPVAITRTNGGTR